MEHKYGVDSTKTELDRIKRKYVKWILGLDREISNYILIEKKQKYEE